MVPETTTTNPETQGTQPIEAKMTLLEEEVRALRHHLQALERPSQPPENHELPASMFAKPPPFDGNRTELRGFLSQLRVFLRANRERIANEAQKVDILVTLLSGPARAWASPFIDADDRIMYDFDAFVAALSATFGDGDRQVRAASNLRVKPRLGRPFLQGIFLSLKIVLILDR